MANEILELDRPETEVGKFERRYSAKLSAKPKGKLPAEHEAIATRLKAQFALPHTKPSSTEDVVRIYDGDRQKLAGWRTDMQLLLDAIGTVNFELRIEGGRKERADDISRLLAERRQTAAAKFQFPSAAPDQTLFATLLLKPPAEVHRDLLHELETQLSQFVKDIFITLDRLVAEDALGTIEWIGDALCKFHYLHDLIIHEPAADQIETILATNLPGDSELRARRMNSFRIDSGINKFRVELHEHELMGAERSSVGSATVIIPREIQPVLDAIPGWLKPMSEIVTGTCVRKRQAQITVKDEEWKKREFIGSHLVTETITTDVFYDPAVTLGNYVLAGWSDADIHREEQLRLRELNAARAQGKLRNAEWEKITASLVGVVFLSFAVTVAFFAAVTSPWLFLAAGGVWLIGLVCTGYGVWQWQVAKERIPTFAVMCVLLALTAGVTLTIGGLGVALLAPSLSAWGVAAIGFCLTALSWRELDAAF